MASSINASTSGAGGVITTADSSGVLNIQTAGNTAVTVDASQNVGIGTTSPNYKLHINSSASSAYIQMTNSSTGTTVTDGLFIGNDATAVNIIQRENLPMTFYTNNTERMRIDSSGNVLVGTTTQGATARLTIKAADTGFGGIAVVQFGGSVYWTQNIDSLDGYTWAKNGSDFWYAGRSGSNNCVSASGSWVNSSDSRLKTNVKTISNALENVCNLRGVSFNRISNNSSEIGLIAQEVLEIYPDAVEKPSTDKDFYGLNYGALVAPLIEAIKEQQTIINDLKARVETLEAK